MNYDQLCAGIKQVFGAPQSGKVRDSFSFKGPDDERRRLSLVSGRRSIFDFRLGFEIPLVGEILNAMDILQYLLLRKKLPGLQQNIVSYGSAIDSHIPNALRGNTDLWKRATFRIDLDMIPVEFVWRKILTGTGWKEFSKSKTGVVCGNVIRQEDFESSVVVEGAMLKKPILTPTTKAHVGHDKPLEVEKVLKRGGKDLGVLVMDTFCAMSENAGGAGFLLADGKVEIGLREYFFNRPAPQIAVVKVLGDERGTADSCRYYKKKDYYASYPHKLPPPYDKQILRNWGISIGIDTRDPTNPDDIAWVKAQRAPQAIVDETIDRLLELFQALSGGISLKHFQRNVMEIR